MNTQKDEVQAPDFSGEEMKLPENAVVQTERQQESSSVINGPLLLVLALLLVLILGGMYYWFATLSVPTPTQTPVAQRPTPEQNNEPESTTAKAQVETTQAVSPSDELSAIEADLEATDLDSMDTEINAIEAELEADAATQPQ